MPINYKLYPPNWREISRQLNYDREDNLRRRALNRRTARLARGEQLLPFQEAW